MTTFKTKAGTEIPLLNLRGKDYLEVAYRLLWFREEKPDHRILTDIHVLTEQYCIMRAEIRDPKSNDIIAMAHKREDKSSFADFMEKAETGAIGRALAQLGYGTQYAQDFDEGERIVDSPLAKNPPPMNPQARPQSSRAQSAQKTLEQRSAPSATAYNIKDANWPDERPKSCEACGSDLVFSDRTKAYYCPNFKNKNQGTHTYWKGE
jgi:hypothetical protein